MARIGVVAGSGKLPIVFAKAARAKGDIVIAFGLIGATDVSLSEHADKMHWLELSNFKKALFLLVTERISRIVLLGKLEKRLFFKDDGKFDEKTKGMLDKIKDRKDSPIFNEVAKALKAVGVAVMDPSEYLKELIPKKGVLTKRAPSSDEWDDISYGKEVAKELSRYEIGQTVVIKDKTVLAMESVEGTDETIKRAGDYSKVGFVAVKVARPEQDMRFDVPMVGPDTLNSLIKSGGSVLAIEEGRTLIMDKDEMVRIADEKGVSIVVI